MNGSDFILNFFQSHLNWIHVVLTQIHFASHAKSPNLVIMLTNLGINHVLQLELPFNSRNNNLVLHYTTKQEVSERNGKADNDYGGKAI